MPKVNLNDVKAWEGEGAGVTPNGGYHILVDDVEVKQGPKGEYWNLTLLIDEGAFAERNLYAKMFFTAKSLGGTKQALEALKVKIPAGSFDLKPTQLTGKGGYVLVRREAYMGVDDDGNEVEKTRPEVKAWSSQPFNTNGSAGVAPGASTVSEAEATFGTKATTDDDDIPFHHIDAFTLASV